MKTGIYLLNSSEYCSISSASVIDLAGSAISLIAAMISLIVVTMGLRIISDLKMKGFDAVCSFHAKLKSNLMILRSKASVGGVNLCSISEAHISAFIWFCIPTSKKNISVGKELYFKDTNWNEFVVSANNTLNVFNASDGQIPLSSSMNDRLETLRIMLIGITSHNPSVSSFNNSKQVYDEHIKFTKYIDELIIEISETTPVLLNDFWSTTKKLSTKKRKNEEHCLNKEKRRIKRGIYCSACWLKIKSIISSNPYEDDDLENKKMKHRLAEIDKRLQKIKDLNQYIT